jgi:hypothetical protein
MMDTNALAERIPDQAKAAWRDFFKDPPTTIAEVQAALGLAEDGNPLLPCERCALTEICDGSYCPNVDPGSMVDAFDAA